MDRLMEIHELVGGKGRGYRRQLEVLNKSGVVLITALWETYCEDIAAEALEILVKHAKSAENVSLELRKRVAAELEKDPNEIAVWSLADDGWRRVLTDRLESLTAARNRKLNTPKSSEIDALFHAAVGLESVSDVWKWTNMTPDKARKKLDKYVALRGDLAHRGAAARRVRKDDVKDYIGHVDRLVSMTGGRVNKHVRGLTGRSVW